VVSRYTWDLEKARLNLAKHGVSFDDAQSVGRDPYRKMWPDPRHYDDDRYLMLGYSTAGLLLLVVTSEHGPRPRIISAWRATKRERREYERR
jgi:uncharacterized DUF497 family protein